jgi:hypothetical protein
MIREDFESKMAQKAELLLQKEFLESYLELFDKDEGSEIKLLIRNGQLKSKIDSITSKIEQIQSYILLQED